MNHICDFETNGILFGSKIKGNCEYDHIPFNLKGIRNRFNFKNIRTWKKIQAYTN